MTRAGNHLVVVVSESAIDDKIAYDEHEVIDESLIDENDVIEEVDFQH